VTGGHAPKKFLAYLVILYFEKRRPTQKYCCSLKVKHLGPHRSPTRLGSLCYCCYEFNVICGVIMTPHVPHWHLTYQAAKTSGRPTYTAFTSKLTERKCLSVMQQKRLQSQQGTLPLRCRLVVKWLWFTNGDHHTVLGTDLIIAEKGDLLYEEILVKILQFLEIFQLWI